MHGGLPFIGVSMFVYGAVGAGALARMGVRRCRDLLGRGRERGRGGACAAAASR